MTALHRTVNKKKWVTDKDFNATNCETEWAQTARDAVGSEPWTYSMKNQDQFLKMNRESSRYIPGKPKFMLSSKLEVNTSRADASMLIQRERDELAQTANQIYNVEEFPNPLENRLGHSQSVTTFGPGFGAQMIPVKELKYSQIDGNRNNFANDYT